MKISLYNSELSLQTVKKIAARKNIGIEIMKAGVTWWYYDYRNNIIYVILSDDYDISKLYDFGIITIIDPPYWLKRPSSIQASSIINNPIINN